MVTEALISGEGDAERISIDLRGPSGNAYSIMGLAQVLANQLNRAGAAKLNIDRILEEMKSGDYKSLVLTFEKYFGDYVDIYNADVLDEM